MFICRIEGQIIWAGLSHYLDKIRQIGESWLLYFKSPFSLSNSVYFLYFRVAPVAQSKVAGGALDIDAVCREYALFPRSVQESESWGVAVLRLWAGAPDDLWQGGCGEPTLRDGIWRD